MIRKLVLSLTVSAIASGALAQVKPIVLDSTTGRQRQVQSTDIVNIPRLNPITNTVQSPNFSAGQGIGYVFNVGASPTVTAAAGYDDESTLTNSNVWLSGGNIYAYSSFYAAPIFTGTDASHPVNIDGFNSFIVYAGTAASGHGSLLESVGCSASMQGTGTLDTIYGCFAGVGATSGTVTNVYAFIGQLQVGNPGGAATNYYWLYDLPDLTNHATNGFGVYQPAGSNNHQNLLSAHLSFGSANVPVISACGTSPSAVTGSDTAGRFATGTGSPVSCTITFAKTYATAPIVLVVDSSATAHLTSYTIGTSTIVLTLTGTGGDIINFSTFGQ